MLRPSRDYAGTGDRQRRLSIIAIPIIPRPDLRSTGFVTFVRGGDVVAILTVEKISAMQ